MAKQKYLVIDINLCHDCNNCFIACKDEFVMNSWLPYTDEQGVRHWQTVAVNDLDSQVQLQPNPDSNVLTFSENSRRAVRRRAAWSRIPLASRTSRIMSIS